MDTNSYTHAESLPSPRLSKDKFSKSKDGEKILLDTRGQVESGQRWHVFKGKAVPCLWLAGTSGTLAHETKAKKKWQTWLHPLTGFSTRKETISGRQTEPGEGEKTWHPFIWQVMSPWNIKGINDFRTRERETPENSSADPVPDREAWTQFPEPM